MRFSGLYLSASTLAAFAGLIAVSLVFVQFPELDLWAARALYVGNGKFLLSDSGLSGFFHKPVDAFLKYSFSIGLLAYLLISAIKLKLPEGWHARLNFVFLTVFIAEVLIINGGLKAFWGRARPVQIVEFGGNAQFSAAWQMVKECVKNCSFTSGHAGMAACVGLLAVLFPTRLRKPWLVISILFTATAGFMRMARGAHFLSDVMISPLIILATAMVMRDVLRLRD